MTGEARDAQSDQKDGNRGQNVCEPGPVARERAHQWDRCRRSCSGRHRRNGLRQSLQGRKNPAPQTEIPALGALWQCWLRSVGCSSLDREQLGWDCTTLAEIVIPPGLSSDVLEMQFSSHHGCGLDTAPKV